MEDLFADLFLGVALIASIWTYLESAIELGIKRGIQSAMKNITIKVNTYNHR